MKEVKFDIWGDEAKAIAKCLGLKMDGDMIDENTKITFTYRSIEGHAKVEVEFEI